VRAGSRDGFGARLYRGRRGRGDADEGRDLNVRPMLPGRHIDGISAVLLPFAADGTPDWDGFSRLLGRTWAAGLTPAVNMDTGYVHLLTVPERAQALSTARQMAAGRRFVAGAFIEDLDGDAVALYCAEIDRIRKHGGVPIVFQSSALTRLDEADVFKAYEAIARAGPPLLAFELGEMFAGFGRIYSTDFFDRLLDLDAFVGLKHSSLDRVAEWTRLDLRDRHRPDFRVYTGNDLAIDMVFYGSDYLLGLSAFSVDGFAARDRLWCQSDARAVAVNDLLQYLGHLAFRPPVPAYRHSAAQFLRLQGVIATDCPHPRSPRRPESDVAILQDIMQRLSAVLAGLS
jgi:dihydrodipicolinate synthase/N-acetylneuraminate lyase